MIHNGSRYFCRPCEGNPVFRGVGDNCARAGFLDAFHEIEGNQRLTLDNEDRAACKTIHRV